MLSRLWLSVVLSVLLLVVSQISSFHGIHGAWLEWGMATASLLICGQPLLDRALNTRRFDFANLFTALAFFLYVFSLVAFLIGVRRPHFEFSACMLTLVWIERLVLSRRESK